MSTRGAIGFRINGVDKIQYNHYDSYPKCLGFYMLEFIRNTSFEKMVWAALRIKLVPWDGTLSKEDEKEICEQENCKLALASYTDKDLQIMRDSSGFLLNSASCCWAYIVNLDQQVLEIYRGLNQVKRTDAGRYASVLDTTKHYEDEKFYGVALLKIISFTQVRALKDMNTWLGILTKEGEEFDKLYYKGWPAPKPVAKKKKKKKPAPTGWKKDLGVVKCMTCGQVFASLKALKAHEGHEHILHPPIWKKSDVEIAKSMQAFAKQMGFSAGAIAKLGKTLKSVGKNWKGK